MEAVHDILREFSSFTRMEVSMVKSVVVFTNSFSEGYVASIKEIKSI